MHLTYRTKSYGQVLQMYMTVENKTETIKIETVSENTKADSFTEESIEVGKSIENIPLINISKSPEYVYKKDLDIPDDSEI